MSVIRVVSISVVSAAISIAVEAHNRQVDKLNEPYIYHPLRVMEACRRALPLGLVAAAAVLHDVIEDGVGWTIARLSDLVPPDICDAVAVLTKQRNEPYDDYVRRCASHDIARIVKHADALDNLARVAEINDPSTRDRLRRKYLRALELLR